MLCSVANAEAIDRIEISRNGSSAEIRISFIGRVQYLRHTPHDEGKDLRIFLRYFGDVSESDLMQEHLASPKTDLVPRFRLIYPELVNALAVFFDERTRFGVKQGEDGRSIVITVPVAKGAKDVIAEARFEKQPAILQPLTVDPSSSGDAVSAKPVQKAAMSPDPKTESQLPPPRLSVVSPAPAPMTATPRAPDNVGAPDGVTPSVAKAEVSPRVLPSPVVSDPAPRPAPVAKIPMVPPAPAAVATPAPAVASATEPTPVPTPVPAAQVIEEVSRPLLADLPLPEIVRPAGVVSEEIERQAKLYLEDARQLLGTRNGVTAVLKLRQVLDLPSNSQSEVAQALIGEGRELSGEISRALVEYELYLKQYPNGVMVSQVRDRVKELNRVMTTGGASLRPKSGPGSEQWMISGGISQYFYFGNSEIEVITPPPPGQLTFAVDRLSLVDQKALITSLDVSARKRFEGYDTRVVLRDTLTNNYLPGQADRNRLNAAYFEQSNKELGYLVRAGRQTGSSGGVLGRFDGLLAGYNITPDWKVNGVYGYPVEFGTYYSRQMYGVSLDYAAQPDRPGFTTYFIEQTVDGVADRRAVGLEGRYFNSQSSMYGMVDYDINFKGLNILMLQANWRSTEGTNYFSSFDRRRSPLLSVVNALPGASFASIPSLSQQLGLDQLRRDALGLTAWSNMFSIGVTHPITSKWQVGGDYRVVSMSGTEGSGTVTAQPGSKNSHVWSGQGIGNGVFFSNDVLVGNASLISAPTYHGQNLGLTYTMPIGELWRLDGIYQLYAQNDNQGQHQTRNSPSLKASYRWGTNTSIEFNYGMENVKEDGPLRLMNSKRQYMYGGYRYDFR